MDAKRLTALDWLAMAIVIIGGVNWGLVGIFSFDLIRVIFGDMTVISRLVYVLVGVAGGYLLVSTLIKAGEIGELQ